jgi:hypothetical protein
MFKSVTSRLIFWITATTALLFSLAGFYAYRNARDQAIFDAERRAILIAESEASKVEEVLRSAEEGARFLGTTLGHTSVSNGELEKVIRAFAEKLGSDAQRPPESGGQRDRDAVEIARAGVPKPHPNGVWQGTSPRATLSGRAALLTQEGVARSRSFSQACFS